MSSEERNGWNASARGGRGGSSGRGGYNNSNRNYSGSNYSSSARPSRGGSDGGRMPYKERGTIPHLPKGALVKFTSELNDTYLGTFHCVDGSFNNMVLFSNVRLVDAEFDQEQVALNPTFSLFYLPSLRDVSIVDDAKMPLNLPEFPKYTDKERAELHDENVEERRLHSSRIGNGVTEEAQAIFDFLSRTMECKWVRQSIYVHDIYIDSPYREDNCHADHAKPQAVQHIRKALTSARKTLGLSSN